MTQLAFYRVLTDTTELVYPSGGNTQKLKFKVTNDIVLDDSSARPMVCFQMDPSSKNETPKAHLEVFIRDLAGADRKICGYHLSGETSRWTMEPFKPEWIRKGKEVDNENILVFKVEGVVGELTIRNVVVFFQRDV